MLLARKLPDSFANWNAKWGSPFGRTDRVSRLGRRALGRIGKGQSDVALRLGGPFSIQGNNDTRVVEYPWAFFEVGAGPDLVVVELGGALSGFQFALASAGSRVINVDPGEQDQAYWELSLRLNDATIRRLNGLFNTTVELRGCRLEDAQLRSASVDRVVSVSTIEHIPPDQLPSLAREIARVLRPGGRAVFTIDMFLDLAPFSGAVENVYGRNIDVHQLINESGLTMTVGDPSTLIGFPQFDVANVMGSLGETFVGTGWPVCAQAVVLEKPPAP